MKRFKKKGFWVFYVAAVLAGAFIIVALGLQNQSPVIPNVSAQMNEYAMGGFFPGDVIHSTPTAYGGHPGSIVFQSAFPGDIIIDGSEMRTIMTCSGCSQTISTCAWQCGATFTECGSDRGGRGSMFGLYGESYTYGICTGTYTSGICIGTEYPTLSTCGIGCGGGGINTLMTCSGSMFGSCGGGGGNTLMTCSGSMFGGCGGGGGNTLMTCSGSMFGSCGGGRGNTLMTCSGSMFGSCGGGIWSNTLSTCGGYGVGCMSKPKKYEPIGPIGETFQSCASLTMYCGINFRQRAGFSASPAY